MSNFADLGLSQPLVDAIAELGFLEPTPIQSKAIPTLLEDEKDLVGLAQTGTGKTAAFGLPLIDLVDTSLKHTQALVLAPTRELCLQITNELAQFGKHKKKLRVQPVYGGSDIGKQIRDIKRGVQIIVATPGRLRDLIRRKAVDIKEIRYVVLDEADEMLNMGFKEELDDILSNTPEDKLTWLFSATMPNEVRRIAKNYMDEPEEISVGGRNTANADIDHQFVIVRPSNRVETLKRFLDAESDTFGLIFCRTRRDSKDVADELTQSGYNADALHGDLNQAQRDRVMRRFRSKQLKVLVATDVAARGIDVNDITHVFHFNIPDDLSFYTHRAGRTGRAGRKGISLVLAHPKDGHLLQRIERKVKIKFSEVRIPTGEEICKKQLLLHIQRIKDAEISEDLAVFLPSIMEELEELDKTELIQRVASLSFNRFLETYKNAPDLNNAGGKRRDRDRGGRDRDRDRGGRGGRDRGGRGRDRDRDRGGRDRDGNMHKLYINVGNMDIDNKGSFISMICDYAKISGSGIGKINMQRTHTYFDVEQDLLPKIERGFKNATFDGRELRVNDGDSRKRGDGDKKHKKKDKRKKWSW